MLYGLPKLVIKNLAAIILTTLVKAELALGTIV